MIKVISYTKKPLTLMGEAASRCWNSKPSPRIGIKCIENGHGRVLEYPDVIVEISGYSARVIRELYTHIVGTSRLQQSTRYVDVSNFDYYTPDTIKNNPKAKEIYDNTMQSIMKAYRQLRELQIPKEDCANLLPIGSHTKMVLKINARAILHMAEVRLCNRAYKEYRKLMRELLDTIAKLDDEWTKIISYAKPKCEVMGYCTEKYSCGKYPKKEDVIMG